MIKIAICDDSNKILAGMKKIVERYIGEEKQEIVPYFFGSGSQLLANYQGGIDIIFLDIKMPGLNGIETAEKIRKIDKDVIIIFLTSMLQYAIESYKVMAGNYITKPVSYARIKLELDRWIQVLDMRDDPYIAFHNSEGRYKILLKKISYIETYKRNILVHTDSGNIICYWKLKEMEAKIEEYGFVRCHSAYLVNLFYVNSIENMEVQLCKKERLPISKTKRKRFLEEVARYWGTHHE